MLCLKCLSPFEQTKSVLMNSMAFLSTRKQAWKLLVQLGSRSYYNDGLRHSTRPTTVNPLKPIRQEEEDMEVDEEDDTIMAMATMTNQRLTWMCFLIKREKCQFQPLVRGCFSFANVAQV
ncbi:hypothetical protein MRB53_001807 [Persea americana]|uniref:Uncharacterized protein n=1 Tax=Persea americana TaxID=3435 RepID=A0ACC2MSY2_PERAE|nr:hypothetical protein MRB53_001807 [Persea americana]